MFHHFHDRKNHIKSQGSINSKQFEKILKLLNKKSIMNTSNLYNLKNKNLPNYKSMKKWEKRFSFFSQEDIVD